mgnify:CR=1 FL=1
MIDSVIIQSMLFFLFILGTIIGSFLNVLGLRWDSKDFGGRSWCPHCSTTLRWFELVPIFSFLIQKGRCRGCGAKISYQYPIIEILTGLIFATVPLWMLPMFCIYIVILIYDFHHKIIPDELVYLAIALSVVSRWLLGGSTLDWLAGPILFTFFASIWFFSRGRAMGFGDAKLGLSIGLLLGATHGFSAIVLAFWIGALASLLYIFLTKTGFLKNSKGLTMRSEVPFAPFMIIGAWISLLLNLDLLHVVLF